MPMPSWFGKQVAPVPIPTAHSFHTAPGWRIFGKPVYTCIEPVQGPSVDPAVLDAIREFDPDVMPIWQIQAYMPPGKMGADSLVKVAHVGLARRVRDPKGMNVLPRVEMPPGDLEAPNVLEFVWMDNAATMLDGAPPTVKPFDWSLYYECRQKFNANESNASIVKRWLDWQDAQNAKDRAQVDEDLAYRKKHLDRAVERILNGVTHKELLDQYMAAQERGGARERKLYAFQGGKS